jgi:hypothetical protein
MFLQDRLLAWYTEFLLEINLKVLLRKAGARFELQDYTYIFAH